MSLDVSLTVSVGTGGTKPHVVELFEANITHNLTVMAEEAGIYKHLWRPEEIGITTAGDLVEPLTEALKLMRDDPQRFSAMNPKNGWGSYEVFLPWIEEYRDACEHHPKATVNVSR